MTGIVIVDTNLLVLLVVGSASTKYISRHKRLTNEFSEDDFELVQYIISGFSEIILIPHVMAELSNLMDHFHGEARHQTQLKLKTLIETTTELPVRSIFGAKREEFFSFGVTDAVILHCCTVGFDGVAPTLLTVDTRLANQASALGLSVIDYRQEFMSG